MTRTPTMQPFSLRDPLPSGITVLEASAGTGKTFAIVALAVRYIADGRRPDQLLLMTFTTAATSELRERLRRALNDAREWLVRHVDARRADAPDELAEILADAPADVVRDRIQRLDHAIANFDAVTVATTHSFCHQVLRGLGVAGDVDADAGFVEDLEGLVDEVVDDIYAREYASGPGAPPFDHATARGVGRTAVRQAFAELTPHAPDPVTPAECRVAFAFDVRAEVDRRKRRAGLLTYDDLQGRLRDVLIDPARGPVVAERLRTRFSVVLIDEFQDTDPVQYRIVYEAFARSGTALVLIGDPKQAIYGFRGAEVRAYLAAAHAATDRRSMTTSWRSDADLLQACDGLFGAARLGDPEIVYQRLEAAARPVHRRPRGLPDRAPLRVRVVQREELAAGDLTGTTIRAPRAREIVAGDLASDVVRLLAGDNEITPGQIAVLVRKRSHAALIRDALRAAGVPAVISQVGSVFATAVALEWLRLLEAIDRSSSRSAVAAAALTVFCGWDADRVTRADDLEWDALHETLAGWGVLLGGHGVAALQAAIAADQQLYARVLCRPDGERELTDLRHLGELLHAAAAAERLHAGGLVAWLAEQIRTADTDTDNDERSRRLESDAAAVQVLTIHAAKGLEFPVVYCPYLWEEGWIPDARSAEAYPVFHTEAGVRTLVVGGPEADGFGQEWVRSRDEQRGEELRLLYVAMTRARHQLVIWWAATANAKDSPLGRLLFSRDAEGGIPAVGGALPTDEEAMRTLARLTRAAGGTIGVERAPGAPGRYRAHSLGTLDELSVSRLERSLDTEWRRASYSAITAAAHARIHPDPDVYLAAGDEPPTRGPEPQTGRRPAPGFGDRVLALADMPAGAHVGTLIHTVLEEADFAAADLGGELLRLVTRQAARHRLDLGDPRAIATALAAALATPLGGPFGGFALAGVPRTRRVDEMAFELPLGGGDVPRGDLEVGALAAVLHAHLAPDDPVLAYADRLALAPFAATKLRGFLTGFVDVVVRVPDEAGGGFAVIDYKTNLLGGGASAPTAWDYRPDAVATAMDIADYPLQALLYLVALHRYLRWRMAGYEPDRDIRGVGYLFVRGMLGPTTPTWGGGVSGVWSWRPPQGLVPALSECLDGAST